MNRPAEGLDDIEIDLNPQRVNLEKVWRMLRATYWSPNVRREVVEAALRNSVVVGAYERGSGEQVGYARGVTDRATFAWLCDVVVDERHRGRGIATAMVQTLIAHPDLQTLRRWCLATRDAHDVYRPLGFVEVEAGRWMERKGEAGVWSEADTKR